MSSPRLASHKLTALCATAIITLFSACATPDEQEQVPLHPAFDVTFDDLILLVEQIPEEVRIRILDVPIVFLDLMAKTATYPPDLLLLIDKEHPVADNYESPHLVHLDDRGLTVTKRFMQVSEIILPDLAAMTTAARIAGTDVTISSAYRSFKRQSSIFNYNMKEYGEEHTSLTVDRPGHSQHQLGTTIDLGTIDVGYGKTREGQWVLENAWRFGFSLSYPQGLEAITGYQYEPWHFRYLGRAATEIERRFFGGVQQTFLIHYQKLMPALQAVTRTSAHD